MPSAKCNYDPVLNAAGSSFHLKASQHLLERWAQLGEVLLGCDEYQVDHYSVRALRGHQPVAFLQSLIALLEGRSPNHLLRAARHAVHANAFIAAHSSQAGIRLPQVGNQLMGSRVE